MKNRSSRQDTPAPTSRWFRPFATAFALALPLLAVGACGDDQADLDYTAVEGELCHDC